MICLREGVSPLEPHFLFSFMCVNIYFNCHIELSMQARFLTKKRKQKELTALKTLRSGEDKQVSLLLSLKRVFQDYARCVQKTTSVRLKSSQLVSSCFGTSGKDDFFNLPSLFFGTPDEVGPTRSLHRTHVNLKGICC